MMRFTSIIIILSTVTRTAYAIPIPAEQSLYPPTTQRDVVANDIAISGHSTGSTGQGSNLNVGGYQYFHEGYPPHSGEYRNDSQYEFILTRKFISLDPHDSQWHNLQQHDPYWNSSKYAIIVSVNLYQFDNLSF